MQILYRSFGAALAGAATVWAAMWLSESVIPQVLPVQFWASNVQSCSCYSLVLLSSPAGGVSVKRLCSSAELGALGRFTWSFR
jgi:hypothetical protein